DGRDRGRARRPAGARLVHRGAAGAVRALGPVRPARPARVGDEQGADPPRDLRALPALLRGRPLRPAGLGARGEGRRHALRRAHDEAPRRLLPVGLGADRLHHRAHPLRTRRRRRVRRGVPGRGAADRLLPLAAGLAPPRLPRRRAPPAARRPGRRGAQRAALGRAVPGVPARPGAGAAHRLRDRRLPLLRLLLRRRRVPRPARQGCRGVGLRRAAGPGPRAAARRPGQRPAGGAGRSRHPRAVPAERPDARRRRGAVDVGGLSDPQRQLGIRPRQPRLQVGAAAGPDARRRRLERRQPAAQRRADRARRPRPARPGVARGAGGLDGPARPVGARRRPERGDPATGLPLHPAGRPALRARLQLAAGAAAPARAGRQGGLRPAARRRVGDRAAGARPRPAGADAGARWPAARHADPPVAHPAASRGGAGGRAVPAV
ncbi:MAG: GH29, partial [uncultured Friedmanniella sp.]